MIDQERRARDLLKKEALRLRSGAGGWGGRSPESIAVAGAIEVVLAALADPVVRGARHSSGATCASCEPAMREPLQWTVSMERLQEIVRKGVDEENREMAAELRAWREAEANGEFGGTR